MKKYNHVYIGEMSKLDQHAHIIDAIDVEWNGGRKMSKSGLLRDRKLEDWYGLFVGTTTTYIARSTKKAILDYIKGDYSKGNITIVDLSEEQHTEYSIF
jgi:hypothetical protein